MIRQVCDVNLLGVKTKAGNGRYMYCDEMLYAEVLWFCFKKG